MSLLAWEIAIAIFVVHAPVAEMANNSDFDTHAVRQSIDAAEPYKSVLVKIVDSIGNGSIDEAVGLMEKHAKINKDGKEPMRRLFSKIYGAAGEYDGHELAAVRQITKRIHLAYVVAYHDESPVLYKFTMYKYQENWRINKFTSSDNVDELEMHTPDG